MKVCLVLLLLGAATANSTPPPPPDSDSGSSSDAESAGAAPPAAAVPVAAAQPTMMQQQPRPQWLNYPMMNQQQQGPYIQGWGNGAQGGFSTLPATIGGGGGGGNWRTVQSTSYGMQQQPQPSYARNAVSYSYQQPMTRSYSYSNQWSSANNQNNAWRAQPVQQANYGSVSASSSGVQDVTGMQQWGAPPPAAARPAVPMGNMMWARPAQSWNTAAYAAPSWEATSWSNGNGNGNGMWYPAAAERVVAAATETSGDDSDLKTVVKTVKTIAAANNNNAWSSTAATPTPWVAGQPTWRKSYTPMGQSGCYSKCRPRILPAPRPLPQPQWSQPAPAAAPMIGWKPQCRRGCGMRPSCGLRAPAPQWSGGTMVCGARRPGGNAQFLQQPGDGLTLYGPRGGAINYNNQGEGISLYGPRGGSISNVEMGGFTWGGQQPATQLNAWRRGMNAALTKQSNDEESEDPDVAET